MARISNKIFASKINGKERGDKFEAIFQKFWEFFKLRLKSTQLLVKLLAAVVAGVVAAARGRQRVQNFTFDEKISTFDRKKRLLTGKFRLLTEGFNF